MLGHLNLDSLTPLKWMDAGLCLDHPAHLWTSGKQRDISAARAVCAACPARNTCLNYAITEGIEHGVWGGFTADERKTLDCEVEDDLGGVCETCTYVAARLIGDHRECDACYKYRMRNGKARPAVVIAHTGEIRFQRAQREADRAFTRANVNV